MLFEDAVVTCRPTCEYRIFYFKNVFYFTTYFDFIFVGVKWKPSYLISKCFQRLLAFVYPNYMCCSLLYELWVDL